jgi:hypothetical protein
MQLKDTMLVGWQINVKLPLPLGALIHGSIDEILAGEEQSASWNWLRSSEGISTAFIPAINHLLIKSVDCSFIVLRF